MTSLENDLRRAVQGEVLFDAATRAVYATDASNFRRAPIGVVLPASIEDVIAVHRVCRDHGAPIVPRGCGTGLAGGAVNRAVVIDFTRHLDAVGPVDAAKRRVRAEPGAINDAVNRAAAAHGLRFAPDPATHAVCTIGGNVATNACGVHSLQGRFDGEGSRTSDNLAALDVLTYDGLRLTVGPTSDTELEQIIRAGGRRGEIYRDLRTLRDRYAGEIRRHFPGIPRRVSGYNLDELLPERGFNVAGALAGTEGTCVTILGATLKLIPRPAAACLLVVGYPEVSRVADHLDDILAARPAGCEMFDEALTEGPAERASAGLPEGNAWVLIELGGASRQEAEAAATTLAARLRSRDDPPSGVALLRDPAAERAVWSVRETGLARSFLLEGAASGVGRQPGWEDAAVAPEDVGRYLSDAAALAARHGYHGAFYGHLGDGCIHVRLDFDLRSPQGIARYRAFLEEAADLVASYGGSLSGEHGDGQQRAELLPRMFGEELTAAFGAFKAIWDPQGLMNPGKIVSPRRLDEDLRIPALTGSPLPSLVPIRLGDTGRGQTARADTGTRPAGTLQRAALRCVGAGACRRPEPESVMCPSFVATRDERHSPRGRAHLVAEMLAGNVQGGWRSTDVREALDLCLACKGCVSECPTAVDIGSIKAEFLHQHFHGRLRPRAAYVFGLIDTTARLASAMPGAANLLTQGTVIAAIIRRAAGIAPQRPLPRVAPLSLQQWFHRRGARNPGGPRVIVWPDTFANRFDTAAGVAAIEVIEAAGWHVLMPRDAVCCGRPLYDHGFLDLAERYLRRSLRALRPLLEPGIPVVGIEPSCVTTFRQELPRMLPHDDEAAALSRQVMHLGEFLQRYGLTPPPRPPGLGLRPQALLWTHCHQAATGGGEADQAVLEAAGAAVEVITGTCCGLAGGWGYEAAHHRLSMACGEQGVLPAVRDAPADALIVANGYSCRSQIEHGAGGRQAVHMAQALQALGQKAESRSESPGPPAAPLSVRLRRGLPPIAAAAAFGAALFILRRRREDA
jgi:FAD/FMN-containing dehydrogenase/Fe-S oxidoreductase